MASAVEKLVTALQAIGNECGAPTMQYSPAQECKELLKRMQVIAKLVQDALNPAGSATSEEPTNVSLGLLSEIYGLLAAKQQVEAIKLVSKETQCSLRGAVHYVDRLRGVRQ